MDERAIMFKKTSQYRGLDEEPRAGNTYDMHAPLFYMTYHNDDEEEEEGRLTLGTTVQLY